MRRMTKRQTERGMALFEKAHKEIRKQCGRHAWDAVRDLLEQCQQYAIRLGKLIEKEEGEGTRAVSILEDYCELVYQAYAHADRMRPGDADKLYKRFCQIVSCLEDAVRNEIPVRREVVFLPYKMSMWDSLESIWRAACEDPDCDAYVIPVPYFDRNPDGSLGELHDEGGLYPEYVPVTGYKDYDFENRRPDMIFIHNPYDEYNYVTSVHPFFYSKNLKQYTEKLIYVPYFILEEPDSDDAGAAEGIAHFCTCPGVIYADHVIVQSEAMRQIYIDVLMKFMKGRAWQRKALEKKILGLGSPKTDRIWYLKKEEIEIPAEWETKIRKSDGSSKKVVLYNTSVGALLTHDEKMLKKMEEVFCFFHKKKEEIVLLWRPHPLMEATIKAMRPKLLEAYQNIVSRYRKEGWGIYDDTADLDRAILLSDAYYGDPSSVVRLCREAGKPVMIQDPEADTPRRGGSLLERPLHFENVYDDGENLWFTEFDYNALIKMDKITHEVKWKGCFPNESFIGERLYNSMAMCGGKLYFAPYLADEIAVYDPETEAFEKFRLDVVSKRNVAYQEELKFFRVIQAAKKVYFIPYIYPGILCYDTEHGRFRCFDDWIEQVEELRTCDWGYFLEGAFADGKLILPCVCADAIVVFDIMEEKSQVIRTLPTGYPRKFCGICRAEDAFYLVSADGTVSKRKTDSMAQEIKRWKLPVSGMDDAEFYPMRHAGDFVYLFPFKNSGGYRIDIRSGQVTSFSLFDDEKEFSGNNFLFLSGFSDGDRLYLSAGNSRRFLEYEISSGKKREYELLLLEKDRELLKEYKEKDFKDRISKASVAEGMADSLEDLFCVLERCAVPEKENGRGKENESGRKIYRELCGQEACAGGR